ncbi:MAG: hypothetical protein EPO52_05730 [Herbiconiux sp.]|uniref:hypothetical protein n=1 Tax=Herbiconiux sp. TaxID=1871186 RepID=UPI0012021561|nr:hypothetical protein [Herbiconiux sp.]TAJ48870.1 MAG: hypothetical protein EPO52_05730 [Herbiconiux sp.]
MLTSTITHEAPISEACSISGCDPSKHDPQAESGAQEHVVFYDTFDDDCVLFEIRFVERHSTYVASLSISESEGDVSLHELEAEIAKFNEFPSKLVEWRGVLKELLSGSSNM